MKRGTYAHISQLWRGDEYIFEGDLIKSNFLCVEQHEGWKGGVCVCGDFDGAESAAAAAEAPTQCVTRMCYFCFHSYPCFFPPRYDM